MTLQATNSSCPHRGVAVASVRAYCEPEAAHHHLRNAADTSEPRVRELGIRANNTANFTCTGGADCTKVVRPHKNLQGHGGKSFPRTPRITHNFPKRKRWGACARDTGRGENCTTSQNAGRVEILETRGGAWGGALLPRLHAAPAAKARGAASQRAPASRPAGGRLTHEHVVLAPGAARTRAAVRLAHGEPVQLAGGCGL